MDWTDTRAFCGKPHNVCSWDERMPSTSAGRPPSPQEAPPGRSTSLLSRIKAPFGSKTRNIAEFYVRPDDPHRQYSPGDVISGSVILKVLKPLRVTHVVVCLHGFVQVYKTPNHPGESYRAYTGSSTPGKTNRAGYFGNGFASLFQDEVILCGEGRLGEGTYQFGYELVFPRDRLPSSIDVSSRNPGFADSANQLMQFERGTISYMITSTLTKPTTISPTQICDRKVQLTEDFDIATLRSPKPRVITLEPLTKRGRAKHMAKKRAAVPETDSNAQGSNPQEASTGQRSQNAGGSQVDGEQPMSPAPSETSFDSCLSSCGTGSAMDSVSQSAITNGSSKAGHHHHSSPHSQQPISSTIELQRQGFLRGDTIQLRIFVQHRKLVKSLHGVIITLYRQARVDMHPALPIVGKEGQDKSEDYYPKSKTGLGGLSLSSAGSSHVFRKDLSQSFASLIINPDTLTADVKAAVRVPEEAFPTISSVPGGMISFKYYVEVVLDLHGKLSGLDRLFPSSGMSTGYGPQAANSAVDNANGPMFSAWGGHLIDTQEIRREKGIVSCVSEVVIGTRDSQRKPGQRAQTNPHQMEQLGTVQGAHSNDPSAVSQPTNPHDSHQSTDNYTDYGYAYDADTYGEGYHYEEYPYDQDYGGVPPFQPDSQSTLYAPPPMHSIPLPDMAEEEQLPEKERLRRAEARLLPSQPPDADEPESSVTARNFAPSAPLLADHHVSAAPAPRASSHNVPPSAPTPIDDSERRPSAAPAYTGPSDPHQPSTDDKQELHRRRLEMERSAPGDELEQVEASGPSEPSEEGHEAEAGAEAPSAPAFLDDDAHVIGTGNAGDIFLALPRYER